MNVSSLVPFVLHIAFGLSVLLIAALLYGRLSRWPVGKSLGRPRSNAEVDRLWDSDDFVDLFIDAYCKDVQDYLGYKSRRDLLAQLYPYSVPRYEPARADVVRLAQYNIDRDNTLKIFRDLLLSMTHQQRCLAMKSNIALLCEEVRLALFGQETLGEAELLALSKYSGIHAANAGVDFFDAQEFRRLLCDSMDHLKRSIKRLKVQVEDLETEAKKAHGTTILRKLSKKPRALTTA